MSLPNDRSTPRWVWQLSALLTLIAVVGTCALQGNVPAPKPRVAMSIYGDRLHYLNEQTQWSTGHRVAYLIELPVGSDETPDVAASKADQLFGGFAGPKGDALGFQRVVIKAVDERGPRGVTLLGIRLNAHIDIGSGPAKVTDGEVFAYEKAANGSWRRNGTRPPELQHLEEYALPSGAKFALTSDIETFPTGIFTYDCLTCSGKGANSHLAFNLYDMLRVAFAPRAKASGLNKITVAIFLDTRRNGWDFPPQLHLNLKVNSRGEWVAPKRTPGQIKAFLDMYVDGTAKQGRRMRREK